MSTERTPGDARHLFEVSKQIAMFGQIDNGRVRVPRRDVVLAREVTVRYKGPWRRRFCVGNQADVQRFLESLLRDDAREHLFAIYLDSAHQVIAFSVVSVGTVNSAQVHPREIYQRAIMTGASALIIAHNHPSGSLEPSTEDRHTTRLLVDAGELLGIPLLDHIIVSSEGTVSFAMEGWLK